MSKKESAKRSNPIAKTAPSQMLSASATPMLSPSKYTKKNLRNLLHLRKSARRFATTHRAETKTNRVEVKSNRAETDPLCAIKFFFCAILSFFSDSFDSI